MKLNSEMKVCYVSLSNTVSSYFDESCKRNGYL